MAEENGAGQAGTGEGQGEQGGIGEGGGSKGSNDFLTNFSDDTRAYVENKGWQDFNSIAKSAQHLEKMVRGDPEKMITLPGEAAAPEEIDQFYNKLGRPETKEGYDFGDIDKNDPAVETMTAMFHEIGLTNQQANKMLGKLADYTKEQQAEADRQRQLNEATEDKDLQKEWGAKYEQQMATAAQAYRALGIDGDTVDKLQDAMGYAGLMRFMSEIGSKIGEDAYIDGNGGGGFVNAMTPQQAQQRIAELKADKQFQQRYIGGEQTALEEMSKLHRMAYS